MIPVVDIVIIDCDDYVGIYGNGKLKFFDEEPRVVDTLQMFCGQTIKSIVSKEVDLDWYEDQGFNLPENLSDVKTLG